MSDFFITGTGTDIGKTWVTCALLRHWRATGRRARAFKPVLSGFDPAMAEASDAGQLLAAMGRTLDAAALDEIDLHPFQEGSMAHSSRPTANPKCLCEALAGGVMKTLVCECSTA